MGNVVALSPANCPSGLDVLEFVGALETVDGS